MRFARTYVAVVLSLLFALSVFAQQTVTSSAQALTLLQRSLGALAGGQALTDVTLTGTARRIAGSDDETGTAVLKALASGASRMDLNLSSGPRSEIRNSTAIPYTGSWSGQDGVSHAIADHNLWTEPAWFSPAITIARALSTSGFVATYIGHETRDSIAVERISVSQNASGKPKTVALLKRLSQIEMYLDSSTLLPVALTFNIHPDDNALLDLPVEVRFSDYRLANGAQTPFHLQKFLNNSLTLDLQFQSVSLNTGLSPSHFTVAAASPPPGSLTALVPQPVSGVTP